MGVGLIPLLIAAAMADPEEPSPPDMDAAVEVVVQLLEASRGHRADDLVGALVDPGSVPDRWVHALRPFGDLELALATSRGISDAEVEGAQVRVLLASAPPLVVVLRGPEPRIVGIEAPACSHCDPRQRWVEDLLAEVRRHGTLRDRLQPDLELMRDGEAPDTRWETWSAALEARLHVDQSVAAMLAGAEVLGTDDDRVVLRYADGAEDRWRVVPTARGWGVVYDDLAASSPLRLSAAESRRWRKVSVRQEVAVATWTPAWRELPASGLVVGHHVIDGAWLPADDTLLLTVLDGMAPWAAWFQVDPELRAVVARHPIPLPDYGRAKVQAGPGAWRAATGDGRALLSALGGLWALEPLGEVPVVAVDAPRRLQATILDGPVARWVDGDGTFGPGEATLPPVGEVVAAWADGAHAEAVLPSGALLRAGRDGWRAPVPACPGGATAAARRPQDGTWLIACASGDVGHALVHQPGDVVQTFLGPATGGTVAAWSGTGRRFAVGAPPDTGAGVLVWDLLSDEPDVFVEHPGVARVAFSGDDERLLTVRQDGVAVAWSLSTVRRARSVRVVETP